MRHRAAYPDRQVDGHVLPVGGIYQWRAEGESHLFTPESIHACRRPCAPAATPTYKSYAKLINEQGEEPLHAAQPARLQARHRRCRSRRSSRPRAS
jgi:glutamate synthase domain-containing protein 2